MASERIATILLDAGAVTLNPKKPYTFASGIRSPIYTDNRLLISLPDKREEIVAAFVQMMKENNWKPDMIAGVATAGIPWAAWIAQEMGLPMVFVRTKAKDHGTGSLVEGTLGKKSRVVVIEDLISSGSSTLLVAKTIREEGGVVVGCAAIFTYGMRKAVDAFASAKVPLATLTDFETLLSVAQKKKYVSSAEKSAVLAWKRSPETWSP